jgi:hypothetical protein
MIHDLPVEKSKQSRHQRRSKTGKVFGAGSGVKVNYQKRWGDGGTVYDQNVTVSKEDMDSALEAIKDEVIKLKSKHTGVIPGDIYTKIMYLEVPIEKKGNVFFTNLTQKDFINDFL